MLIITMCDACKNYYLTDATGWVEADSVPPDAVASTTYHEPMKMFERAWWSGPTAISSDTELVDRLYRDWGRKPGRAKRRPQNSA
jgi:hypothetical protein